MKLKKIASLMLAGVMAVSMLAGCAETNANSTPNTDDGNVDVTPAAGKSSVFASALAENEDWGDIAKLKITMKDDADLQSALDAAAQNVGSATIIDFTNAIRTAGTWGGSGVRVVANFEDNGDVWTAIVNNGIAQWNPTNARAGDLSVVAADMDAVGVSDAFRTLIPGRKEAATETVTMLFAVDGFIGVDAAVAQVADVIAWEISELKIDDDNSADINCGPDATHLHYEYTGAVSVTNRTLPDNHGMGLNIIAVQITRTAKA